MYKTVAEYYEGKSVFVTGCTGFLGKVLLEKLLYSCPGLDKVYVLIRNKNNMGVQNRIAEILKEPLFSRLKENNPQALEKIVPISGDISKPQMDIKAEDEKLLIDQVSIVFHVAATVKFNEPFEVAMNINVAGAGRVLNLSQRMKNIKAFVHVSTAYSNCDREVIEEIVYPAPASLNEVKKLQEIGITEKETKEIIGKRPNTYTFTKALAENIIKDNHGNIPTVIIRPSIVSSSKVGPIVGWVNNWYGATALITTIAKGLNRVILARPTNVIDLIPVDYVTNLIIVAAASCKSSKDVLVCNSTTSEQNPLTLQHLQKLIIKYSKEDKFYDIPKPSVHYTQWRWVVVLLTLIYQIIPALIMDLFLLLTGKHARFMKMQARVSIVRDTLEFFTSRSWVIRASNARALFDSLSPSDKEIFPCDPVDIDWNEYIPTYMQGIKRFLCK